MPSALYAGIDKQNSIIVESKNTTNLLIFAFSFFLCSPLVFFDLGILSIKMIDTLTSSSFALFCQFLPTGLLYK